MVVRVATTDGYRPWNRPLTGPSVRVHQIRFLIAAKKDCVTLGCQSGLWPKGENAMSLAMVMALEILAALALGFVIGRIWQIRRDELDRRNFKVPPVARIPRRQNNGYEPLTVRRSV